MKKISLILCFVLASMASATTYYLDADRPDDSGDGLSAGAAKKTWSAIDTLLDALGDDGAGDTVMVYTGDYGVISAGVLIKARDDWLAIEAALGESPTATYIYMDSEADASVKVKFDGFSITQDGTAEYCVKIADCLDTKFWNMDLVGDGYLLSETGGPQNGVGFWLYGPAANIDINDCTIVGHSTGRLDGFVVGINIKGSDVTVRNTEISECYFGIKFEEANDCNLIDSEVHNIASDNVLLMDVDGILIQGNDIYDLEVYKPTLTETPTETVFEANGLEMNNGDAKWNTAGATFAGNCELWVMSGNNVKIGTDNVYVTVVSDTKVTLSQTIADGGTPSNVVYYFRGLAHTDLVQANAAIYSDNVTVRGNKFHREGGHQIVWFNPALYPDYDDAAGHNWLIENNLFYTTEIDGADEENASTVRISAIDGLTFRNNIVITASYSANYTIVGNIISKAENWGNYSEISEEGYNIINRDNVVFEYAVTSDFLDGAWDNATFRELFADFDANDFTHASAESLGVGHGDPENSTSADILGVSRDGDPDAGCYEYENGNGAATYLIGSSK